MVICLVASACILAFIEYYSLGVMCIAKKAGIDNYKKALIPFYAFYLARKISGIFTILTIPVKKFHTYMLTLVILGILALIYASWGSIRLPAVSAESLWQIMSIILILCSLLAWAGLVISSKKIFRVFKVKNQALMTGLSFLILPIPILYMASSKNIPDAPSELY